jgi:lipopolysaccharide/colanic/teichoic acid biosynthesis glycosyltransferase/GGDEF domain-containing protein
MDQTTYFTKKLTQNRPKLTRTMLLIRLFGNFAKRFMDIFVAFVGLLFLSPVFLLISILIKRDSPGPVFFKGKRLGKNGHPFDMWKFRTMFEVPISYMGSRITCKGDDRITPFGCWLRETKINELPQLWNVLKGDMSLVGPRPEDVIVGNDWDAEARKEILSIRPGITSPASILYHDEELLLSKSNIMEDYFKNILPDKIRLDRLYVRNRSFSSDIDIIFWTLAIIIPKLVKEKIPEGYFFSGPFTRLINRQISWFLLDTITSLIVISFVRLLWSTEYPVNFGINHLLILVIVPTIIYSGINTILGINRIDWANGTLNDAITLGISSLSFTFLLGLSNHLAVTFHWFEFKPLSTSLILLIGFTAQMGFLATRYSSIILSAFASIWLNWRRKVLDVGERVLIVGAGKNFSTIKWLISQEEFQYFFRIIGVVDDTIPKKYGVLLNGCLVLGSIADIPYVVQRERIDVIIFTTLNIPKKMKDYIDNLKTSSAVRLIFLDYLSDIINQQLTSQDLSPARSTWSEDYYKFRVLYDSVTGLPNWILFRDHLCNAIALAKRNKIQPKVMYINLDLIVSNLVIEQKTWFEILRKVTDRLQKIRRESDTLVFLGIHGFAFIFYNDPDENSIRCIADRIIASLSQPITYNNQSFILDAKIYISTEIDNPNNIIESYQEEVLLDYLVSQRKLVRTSYG